MDRRRFSLLLAAFAASGCTPAREEAGEFADAGVSDPPVSDPPVPPPEERDLSFIHSRTREAHTVTYWRDGEYVPEGLDKLDYVLRDDRPGTQAPDGIDPGLYDFLYHIQQYVEAQGIKHPVFEIVSAYRTLETNRMLGNSDGSQHVKGTAIDFRLDGHEDKLKMLLEAAHCYGNRGGVGYYPDRRNNFIHIDVGAKRHWQYSPQSITCDALSPEG